MARKQANPLVSFNFDSLTDTITNLTGTLILVVVLVLGITGRSGRGGLGAPESGRTAEALLQQLSLLQQHARQVDQRMKDLQALVTAVESRARAAPQGPSSPAGTGQAPAGPASEKPGSTPGQKPPTGPKPPQPPTPPRSPPPNDQRDVSAPVHSRSRTANCRTAPDPDASGGASSAPDRQALVEQVRAAVAAAHLTIELQSGRLTALREQIEQLRRQLANIESRPPDAEAKRQPGPASGVAKGGQSKGGRQDAKGKQPASNKKKPVTQFTYRPPIEQFTTKTPIRFICQENRVSVMPPDEAIAEKIAAFASANRVGEDQPKPFEFDLPDHDFRFRGEAGKTVARFEPVRKADRPGETGEAIRQSGSRFLEAMKGTPQRGPGTHCVLFYVWPDSFDVYRQARSLVWETRVEGLQYSDGWEVMLPADPIRFVRQPGRNVHVVQPH